MTQAWRSRMTTVLSVGLVALALSACGGPKGEATARTVHLDSGGTVEAGVVLYDGLDEGAAEEVHAQLARIITFFDARFGVSVPEFTVYLVKESDTLESVFKDVTGFRLGGGTCFAGPGPAIFLVDGPCRSDGSLVLEHEYFHLLQIHLAGFGDGREGFRRARGPLWLLEGMADYAEALYRAEVGPRTYEELRDQNAFAVASWAGTLETTGDQIFAESYVLGFLAVDLLVQRAGEEALLDYYRSTSTGLRWREAFSSVFGIGVDEFYEEFERHRAENRPPFHTISGSVVGPRGDGLRRIGLVAISSDGAYSSYSLTVADGGFVIAVPAEGWYAIAIYPPPTSACTMIGWYEEDSGFVVSGGATYVEVRGGDVEGITVRLPDAWWELEPIEHCAEE
ncbi:MAG: collagenase [Chloroflexi bacterium]|nr:collagenase [Chloroflexota bacterium]